MNSFILSLGFKELGLGDPQTYFHFKMPELLLA
jgi:hypothetical protein